jgi:hypothetical protein
MSAFSFIARSRRGFIVLALLALAVNPLQAQPPAEGWINLAPGLDLGRFKAYRQSYSGDSAVVVLRMNPQQWEPRLLSMSGTREAEPLTVRQWSDKYHLVAAINAGMFATDNKTHVGFMKCGEHLNSRSPNSYRSAAVFTPVIDSLPPFRIVDLDDTDVKTVAAGYRNVVQNLRLIKRPGTNCWSPQEKIWSEAALGEDKEGRMLLIYCRSPYSMYELNEILLSLPLDIVAAQHLEGGSEAQLYVNYAQHRVELVGGSETRFDSGYPDDNAWPIPNVIGIVPRSP